VRTVLLTGGTGAIGSVLAKRLIADGDTRVRLLLRARSAAHLSERLSELYRFWQLDSEDRSVSARVEALAGDVTMPRLALDEATYQRLTSEVTHVVHSAGNVKLNRPLEEARRSAVDAVGHILSFVDRCRAAGSFRKLEAVSTVGVAGRTPGVIAERAFREPRSFRNTYEAAKAEAETVLLDRIDEGLPATIHRPSMVVGDSMTGTIVQFQVFYYLCEFLSGRTTGGVVPDGGDVRLDIIPVDYVARAIDASMRRDDAVGRIFHLCSGPELAPRVNVLGDMVRQHFTMRGHTVPPLRRVAPAAMLDELSEAARGASEAVQRSLQTLPHFLAYLDEPQTFAHVRTREFLGDDDGEPPSVEHYLKTVLDYYLAKGLPDRGDPQLTASRGAA